MRLFRFFCKLFTVLYLVKSLTVS